MKRMGLIFILVILAPIGTVHGLDISVKPTEIASVSGSENYEISNTTTLVDLNWFVYEPGNIVSARITLHTEQEIVFGSSEYGVQIIFQTHYFGNKVAGRTDWKYYSNDTTRYYNDILEDVAFRSDIYVSLIVVNSMMADPFFIRLDYEFRILELQDELRLDEYQEHELRTTMYPEEIWIPGTVMNNQVDDLVLLMPKLLALNETLGVNGVEYNYIYDIELKIQVQEFIEVGSYSTYLQFVAGYEQQRSNKIHFNGLGNHTFYFSNITNVKMMPMVIEHSGAELLIQVVEVRILVSARMDIPREFVMTPGIKVISTVLAALLGFLSYKIVVVFDRNKVKSKLEVS